MLTSWCFETAFTLAARWKYWLEMSNVSGGLVAAVGALIWGLGGLLDYFAPN